MRGQAGTMKQKAAEFGIAALILAMKVFRKLRSQDKDRKPTYKGQNYRADFGLTYVPESYQVRFLVARA